MKPVDIIILMAMHDLAAKILNAPPAAQGEVQIVAAGVEFREYVARSLLQRIAGDGQIAVVLAALAAVGGPSSLCEAGQRLDAAIDSQRRSFVAEFNAAGRDRT